MIYTNSKYLIKANLSNTGYELINKQTKIIEFKTNILPEAIKMAELFEEALINHSKTQKMSVSFN